MAVCRTHYWTAKPPKRARFLVAPAFIALHAQKTAMLRRLRLSRTSLNFYVYGKLSINCYNYAIYVRTHEV